MPTDNTDKIEYNKPFQTVEEQAESILQYLSYTEKSDLENILNNINYYKLGLYIYPFRINHSSNELATNTSLDNIMSLYKFDKDLRLLLLDAIETIETTMAMKLAYHIGEQDKFIFYKEHSPIIAPDKELVWCMTCAKVH